MTARSAIPVHGSPSDRYLLRLQLLLFRFMTPMVRMADISERLLIGLRGILFPTGRQTFSGIWDLRWAKRRIELFRRVSELGRRNGPMAQIDTHK